jgi:hypothetical protein
VETTTILGEEVIPSILKAGRSAILILARGVHAASTSASAGSLETFKNGPVSGCRSDLKVALRIKMRIAAGRFEFRGWRAVFDTNHG